MTVNDFREKYLSIWKLYQRYGERILEVDLADNEELKNIFVNAKNYADFSEKIADYWKKHHQVLIKNCSDIAKAYEKVSKNQKIFLESKENYDNIAVSTDFFEKLMAHIGISSVVGDFVYIHMDEYIYIIVLHKENSFTINKKISLSKMLSDN